MMAAKAWGLTPAQWRAQTVDDRARMLAFVMFEATREAYAREWYESRGQPQRKMDDYLKLRETLGLPT